MKLTYKDEQEITAIIASLSDADHERIRETVEYRAERDSANPIMTAIREYYPGEHTKLACNYLDESDVDYQQRAGEMLFDVLTMIITREYAVEVFMRRHSFDEVA
ncbi:hypothetical protein [Pantoea sp. 1.19]|uniref:hypothetical protein n=1 Tax=Pantoea sp. 1.19 TaxID=1925589 RepID=UPI000948D060|nr:hypothetical protein [Pantoea sp. 1.19]